MNRRQKIIVSITGIFIVMLALVGLTYAYFLTRITGNENDKSISVTTANLELVYGDDDGSVIGENEGKIEPDKTFSPKTFTVTNNGNSTIDEYAVILDNVSITYAETTDKVTEGDITTLGSTIEGKDNDFTLVITCKNQDNEVCNGYNAELLEENGILLTNSIEVGEKHTYTAILTYNETDKNQSADMNKRYDARFNIIETKDTVDISGIVSNYKPGDYVQTNSTKRLSVINSDGSYKIVGLEAGTHTVKVCSKAVNKTIEEDNCSTPKMTETINVVKGETALVDNTSKTITITDYLRNVKLNIDVNNSSIKYEIPEDEKNIVYLGNMNNTFNKSIAREDMLTKATKKTFTITNTGEEKLFVHIKMEDIVLPEALKRYDFMWSLYEGDKNVSNGSFEYAGESVEVGPYQVFEVDESKTYHLYVWIEETGLDQVVMMGQTFTTKIKAVGETYHTTPESCFTFENGTITNYDETTCGTDVIIPETIDAKPVTGISNDSFIGKLLTSVVIPNSVTEIGSDAFGYNVYLTNVIIPNSVTEIGNNAFGYNQLTNVIIPNSVTSIGDYAFGNNQLTNVVIPNSVAEIGHTAFGYNQLTSVVISNSVTSIGTETFAGNQLTNVVIPNSVTYIGDSAFIMNQLTSVVIPNSVTSIEDYAFGYNQLTNVIIPNSVTSIGDYAFGNNPNLTSIVIKRPNAEGMTLDGNWNCLAGSQICEKTAEVIYNPNY